MIDPPPRASRKQVLTALKDATFALGLPLIVIVGLKFGVFTPTEAAVVAAVYALFISMVIYRELKVSQLYALFQSAAQTTAVGQFAWATAQGGTAIGQDAYAYSGINATALGTSAWASGASIRGLE